MPDVFQVENSRVVLSVLIASALKTLSAFLVSWTGCLASRADDKKLWAIKMDKSQDMIIIPQTHDVSVVNNDGGASSITSTWLGNLTHEQNLRLQDESHYYYQTSFELKYCHE